MSKDNDEIISVKVAGTEQGQHALGVDRLTA